MSRYRKVDPRIWNDKKFRELGDRAKLVFFMLLTHPNMTAIGAMRGTMSGLAEELEWSADDFRKAFAEALAKGMVEHDPKACLIALPNFIRYNPPESPNVVKAWVGALDLLPECSLKTRVVKGAESFAQGMTEAFGKAFAEAFAKAMPNQEQEQEQKQETTMSGLLPDGDAIPSEKKERRQTRRFTPEDEKCARWLFGRNLAVNATAKAPNFATWSEDVRLMREIDGRTHAGICELYQWAKKDAFWSPNIQSPGKLREKWDQLTEQKMRPAKLNGAAPKDGRFFGLNEIDRSGDVQAAAANREKHGIVIDPDDDYDFNAPPAPPKDSK